MKRFSRRFITATATAAALITFTTPASADEATILLHGEHWLGGKGVAVCRPGTGTTCDGRKPVGLAWQCVELAQRLYNVQGWHDGLFPIMSAYQIFWEAPKMGMETQPNGRISSIVPGDMIIHDRNEPYSLGNGHVSVVDSVNGETVYAVEQNTYNDTPRTKYSLNGGRLSRRGSGTLLGVVHSPRNKEALQPDAKPPARYHRNLNKGGGDDVLMYGEGSRRDVVLYGNENRGVKFLVNDVVINGSYDRVVKADFNGDHYGDLLFYGRGSDPDAIWFGSETRGVFDKSKDISINGDYDRVPAGDFNGDGKSDLLFYGSGSKPDFIWLGSAKKGVFDKTRTIEVDGSGYTTAVGDFNGDRRFDIVWDRPQSGDDSIWYGRDGDGTFDTRPLSVTGSYEPVSWVTSTGTARTTFCGMGADQRATPCGSGVGTKIHVSPSVSTSP